MATTYVTVPGANHTNIVNPFDNTFNTAVAQSISQTLFAAQAAGTLFVQNFAPPTPPPVPPGDVGEIQVTTPGAQDVYVPVTSGYTFTAVDQAVTGPLFIDGGGSLFIGNQSFSYIGAPAAGTVSIAAGNGNNFLELPTGSDYVVALGNGNNTVEAQGSGTIDGGTGSSVFNLNSPSGNDDIISNGNNDTINAGAGDATVTTFGTNPIINGGSGNLVYLGGAAGNPTITGTTGTGMSTLFGGSGQNITYLDNSSGAANSSGILAAGSGNETLNAGGSSAGVQLAAGVGSVDMVGSTGPDTFYGGAGYATMTGNGGPDVFVFGTTPAGHQGGTDIITDFNSSDTFILGGYGPNAAATAFADATYAGGNSTVKLSDGTTITFDNINTTTGTWKTLSFS